ncbi:MAG: hypothetical protein V3W28_08100, partial [Thermoplasmata archaeon]
MEPTREGLNRLRSWLDGEPVRYAHVIHLLSLPEREVRIWVDDDRQPHALLGLRPETRRLVATAEPPQRLEGLLDFLPGGAYRLTSVDVELVPAFER